MTQIDATAVGGRRSRSCRPATPCPRRRRSRSRPPARPGARDVRGRRGDGRLLRRAGRQRVLRAGPLRSARAGRRRGAVPVHPRQRSEHRPGSPRHLADLATRRIILDDDNNDQNDAVTRRPPTSRTRIPDGGLAVDNRFRVGDSIDDLTGVLHWSFAGATGTDAWRIRPIPDQPPTFAQENPAPAAPPVVGGCAAGGHVQRPQLLHHDRHDVRQQRPVRTLGHPRLPGRRLGGRAGPPAGQDRRRAGRAGRRRRRADRDPERRRGLDPGPRRRPERRRRGAVRGDRHRDDRHRRHQGGADLPLGGGARQWAGSS